MADKNAPAWQAKYADPKWQERLTKLSPGMESDFMKWVKDNSVPLTPDYDMRGFYKAMRGGDPRAVTGVNQNDGMLHFTDTWKTPLHHSFSGESIYANPGTQGPRWNPIDQLVNAVGQVLFDERAKPAPKKGK